ncbi:hypothetical protein [Streptomyces chartreusis]|uniref:hypothetical protein n=1 Tax=Streptomyces chartreusis TaxID=1969 RepID=UPI0036509547
MFEPCLYGAKAATALLAPHSGPMILPPPRLGVRPQAFAHRADATEWTVAQRYRLPALVSPGDPDLRRDPFGRRLASALETCLRSTGF